MGTKQQAVYESLSDGDKESWKLIQAKSMKGSQLTDFLKGVDLSGVVKPLGLFILNWIEKNLLPKLQQSNSMAAMVLAGLLDAMEAQLS